MTPYEKSAQEATLTKMLSLYKSRVLDNLEIRHAKKYGNQHD